MPGCALKNCVRGHLVIHDHGAPAGRVTLGADDGAKVNLTSLFQNLKEDLHLALIAQCVEKEVIQNKESRPTDSLQAFLVFHVVHGFKRHKLFQKDLTVMVLYLVVVAGDDPQGLCQIGFAAVRRPQDAEIHAGCDEIQR